MARPLVVWRFTDGKAGHENQSAGLLAALRRRVEIDEHRLQAADCRSALSALIMRRFPCAAGLPVPDLHIGAGSATHLPMLAARRARGGRVIVLMKPGPPLSWFDLCIIPAHDRPPQRGNVLVTRGVLNRIVHGEQHDPGRGLILVGGPSAHVNWSDAGVAAQVEEVVAAAPDVRWQLAGSRRTPEELLSRLGEQAPDNLVVVPVSATGADWLPRQLARAGRVWVTEDSVSMVYEALTSGAAVGLLDVPFHDRQHRLALGVGDLVRARMLTRIADWRAGSPLQTPGQSFDEAARCADWIAEHWLEPA